MINDTIVTIQGWVGSEPQLREVAGTSVTNFRVGCTPRRFNRTRQEWVDGATQWYGVSAWRVLGEHCKRSLNVGDAVIVHGRLNARTYDRNGVEATALEIDAVVVGHDLTRGVTAFSKTVGQVRRDERPQEQAATPADPWGADEVQEPAVAGAA
ncbi:single-stranded DNA-binding protein [Nocardioides sp. MH1]|uniref:single-stranded DNA-binding protein n=1 Tax=Nocardioides sp. MH1 TaxID=3242490 RepID=UPI003522692E